MIQLRIWNHNLTVLSFMYVFWLIIYLPINLPLILMIYLKKIGLIRKIVNVWMVLKTVYSGFIVIIRLLGPFIL